MPHPLKVDREANLTALYYPRGRGPATGPATAEVVLVVRRDEGLQQVIWVGVPLWTLTSGFDAMSGHLVVDHVAASPGVIRDVGFLRKDRHGIAHVTVQVEDEALASEAARLAV